MATLSKTLGSLGTPDGPSAATVTNLVPSTLMGPFGDVFSKLFPGGAPTETPAQKRQPLQATGLGVTIQPRKKSVPTLATGATP
jgi:hypothetical protein